MYCKNNNKTLSEPDVDHCTKMAYNAQMPVSGFLSELQSSSHCTEVDTLSRKSGQGLIKSNGLLYPGHEGRHSSVDAGETRASTAVTCRHNSYQQPLVIVVVETDHGTARVVLVGR